MSEWQEVSLGNVADFVTDKIAASNVTLDNYISTDNMQVDRGGVVPAATLPQVSKFNHYKPTDTLFSNIRTYFRKVWLADRAGGASADVLIFRTKDEKKLNPLYLYYLISEQEFVDFTVLTAKGAKMPRGDKGAMMQFKLHLPSLEEQIDIVESLRCIDQKIEMNQRMNETLEGMARAIFKSWFVDFDPVHAKAEGRTPEGMDSATASLFPAAFTPNGLPDGWEEKPLGDYITVKRGGSPRPIQDYLSETGLPWVKISDATACTSPYLMGTKQFIKKEGLKKTTLLKAGTLILSNSATPGLPRFLNLDACIHDGWLHFPEKRIFTDYYLYNLFLIIKEQLISQGNGSVFTNLKTDILKNHKTPVPDGRIIKAFDCLVAPMFEQILENEKQNQTLAALRDTLLPKLISGELRVDLTTEPLKEAVG